MKQILAMSIVSLSFAGISACSFVATVAKESLIGATGRFGSESFTLVGEFPENLKMDIWTLYGPIKKGPLCEYYDVLAERTVTRGFGQPISKKFQTTAHTATFEIPLTYSVGLCEMKLGEVKLEIDRRYGNRKDQESSGIGRFYVVKNLPAGAPAFDYTKEIKLTSRCRWSFQQRQRSSPPGELEKSLRCSGAQGFLLHDQLANKTVRINFSLEKTEKPSRDDSWIEFPTGWKPCLPKPGGWVRCQNPPIFRTFEMNGQTCSIYPGCTE